MSYNPMFPTTKGILRKLGGDKIDPKYLPYAQGEEDIDI